MNLRILFIHHSTGGNLIREGNLRQELRRILPEAELWDHNYNLFPIFPKFFATHTHLRGLSDQAGNYTGTDYRITIGNDSPSGYADIFRRKPNDPMLSQILRYDCILFKNCYPTTRIGSDEKLSELIRLYTDIREHLIMYPSKLFVLMTPPPARRETTNTANAGRAIKLATFLTSPAFLSIHNLRVFDLFGNLSDHDGFLKREYTRAFPFDSHPNHDANSDIAPKLAIFLAYETRRFRDIDMVH